MHMPSLRCKAILAAILLALAGCGSEPPDQPRAPAGTGGHYKLGKPYQINGRWYHPEFDPAYDRTGIASWYGSAFHGKATANGEVFDKDTISAAHTTLPLPSIVEVTNLENGRSLQIRVNDRGPFVGDRLIDLSEAAATELGFREDGLARVRVRFIGLADASGVPPAPQKQPGREEVQVADLAPATGPAIADGLRPGDLVDPAPARAEEQASSCAAVPAHFVQIAAYSDPALANRASRSLRQLGDIWIDEVNTASASLFRLRVGPLETRLRAFDVMADLRRQGYHEAFVVSC